MAQPPVPGHGAGEQPSRDARLPGGSPDSRDPRLAAFAGDNAADRCPPGAWTGMVLNELSGSDRHCADATDDELIGLPGGGPGLPARANLTFPLATLLGLADRPGEGHGRADLHPRPHAIPRLR